MLSLEELDRDPFRLGNLPGATTAERGLPSEPSDCDCPYLWPWRGLLYGSELEVSSRAFMRATRPVGGIGGCSRIFE